MTRALPRTNMTNRKYQLHSHYHYHQHPIPNVVKWANIPAQVPVTKVQVPPAVVAVAVATAAAPPFQQTVTMTMTQSSFCPLKGRGNKLRPLTKAQAMDQHSVGVELLYYYSYYE
jgi:hypothetical protein